ncbi:bifunctional adenosylcobinamide kinase/adenosylcobinamide-phosphate guanylyltransferase [Metabacillus sp. 84]|uniref:bifunctional adenosylcobinamide kinase/adenosylcobinamide-phosphate guanylyltransferase n=1 Tax=Metabacillus sp. 84 TaxID=3404705 RepID=UPI003CF3AA91
MLIFISGGVRSGKTALAENFAKKAAGRTYRLNYIAAGRATDSEMEERIMRHKEGRLQSEAVWRTFEQSVNLHELAVHYSKRDILVLDCLTTWLNHEMFSLTPNPCLLSHMLMGVRRLRDSSRMLIVVSNELSFDAARYSPEVSDYIRLLGKLHQETVKIADSAYLAECGIPLMKKGVKP